MLAEKIPPLHFQIPVIFTFTHSTEGAPTSLGFEAFLFLVLLCFGWGFLFGLVFWWFWGFYVCFVVFWVFLVVVSF